MMPEIRPDAEDYDNAPTMREAIDMHIGNAPDLATVERWQGIARDEEMKVKRLTEELTKAKGHAVDLLMSRDALKEAINEAVHIFDRDGGESQSAWNMRAVLLQALDKLESKQP